MDYIDFVFPEIIYGGFTGWVREPGNFNITQKNKKIN